MMDMEDGTLRREIEVLLTVDPAPDYRARVRQRIAAEPPPGSTHSPWRLVRPFWAAASAAVAAIIALGLIGVDREPPPPPLAARTLFPGNHIPPSLVPGRPAVLTVVRPRATRAPEVILDPAEVKAWHRLLSGADSVARQLPATPTTAPASNLAESEDLLLPPIRIEPLISRLDEGVQP